MQSLVDLVHQSLKKREINELFQRVSHGLEFDDVHTSPPLLRGETAAHIGAAGFLVQWQG